jgi:hypothetical protein
MHVRVLLPGGACFIAVFVFVFVFFFFCVFTPSKFCFIQTNIPAAAAKALPLAKKWRIVQVTRPTGRSF